MIVVFGSINVDLAARVTRLPRSGETLIGRDFSMQPGGKGANQALGARRAGAPVHLFGCVGRDPMAAVALQALGRAGVDLGGVRECGAATGAALIHVDDAGENCITVVPGANAEARADQVPDALLTTNATVLMQLEVPLAEVAALARRARRHGTRIVLNAAPALALPAALRDDVDVLVVNETEAMTLTGADVDAACRQLAGPARAVVVTRGAKGALGAWRGEIFAQATPRIEVVDTVGAGDAFSAALAAALDRGDGLDVAMREGVAAGSLACLRAGAQDALPPRDAIVRMATTLPR
jgi:ribokinase